MGIAKRIALLGICIVLTAACQPKQEQAPATAGKVLMGDYAGKAFTIATGNATQTMQDLIDNFNAMDAEALWTQSADTVLMYMAEGPVVPLTQEAMAEMFATVDSLNWQVGAYVPVKIEGSEYVHVLAQGTEHSYFKDGTEQHRKLFERFVFRNDTLLEVHQWTAALPEEE